jgi:hypothetical protein
MSESLAVAFDASAASAAWPNCPPKFIEAIERYCNGRVRTGSFLEAVLCNDLKLAVPKADFEAQACLRDIVGVIYQHVPLVAWGSRRAVRAWLEKRPLDERDPVQVVTDAAEALLSRVFEVYRPEYIAHVVATEPDAFLTKCRVLEQALDDLSGAPLRAQRVSGREA